MAVQTAFDSFQISLVFPSSEGFRRPHVPLSDGASSGHAIVAGFRQKAETVNFEIQSSLA